MKARYVRPMTVIVHTETESDMIRGTNNALSTTKRNTLFDAPRQKETIAPGIGGDEEHSGDDDLEAAKRNWSVWDEE